MVTTEWIRYRRWILAILAILVATALAFSARADNLFPVKKAARASSGSSSASSASLFSDLRAHDVGDLVTIVISENTTAQSAATTNTSNENKVDINAGTGLFKKLFNYLTATATNSRSGKGQGTTTRSGALQTTLTVLVKEVLPNGTLRLEGARLVGINREMQKVTFSGIVRPEDITPDNSISSTLVADVQVRYDGKGVVAETQRLGFLSSIMRFLF